MPAARMPAVKAAPDTFAPWSVAMDLGRQQVVVAAESTAAMARGFDAMRKIPLPGPDAGSVARYWQDIMAATLEMQTELLGCCTHLVDSESLLHATASMDGLPGWTGLNGLFPVRPVH